MSIEQEVLSDQEPRRVEEDRGEVAANGQVLVDVVGIKSIMIESPDVMFSATNTIWGFSEKSPVSAELNEDKKTQTQQLP